VFDIKTARNLLTQASVFFNDYSEEDDTDEDKEYNKKMMQTLNMNDTWAWACADGEYVPDDKLPEVARLFWYYGQSGLLYWASEQNDQLRSEFHHYNRAIDFVRHEENLVKKIPDHSTRAYTKINYTLGDKPWWRFW